MPWVFHLILLPLIQLLSYFFLLVMTCPIHNLKYQIQFQHLQFQCLLWFHVCFKFLMYIKYSVLSCKLVISFLAFPIFILSGKKKSEAATKGALQEKVFLELLQNSQESPATLLKKRLWHRCFPVNFVKFLRRPFLQNTSWRLLLKTGISLWSLCNFSRY